jgi:hypothetical protein
MSPAVSASICCCSGKFTAFRFFNRCNLRFCRRLSYDNQSTNYPYFMNPLFLVYLSGPKWLFRFYFYKSIAYYFKMITSIIKILHLQFFVTIEK